MLEETLPSNPIGMPSNARLNNVPGGWSFVINTISVSHALPYEISPGIQLAKASEEQVSKIKQRLDLLLAGSNPGWYHHYESAVEKPITKGFIPPPRRLESDLWRYYIIETNDAGKNYIDLQYASNASLIPLDICSLQFMNNGGLSWRTGSLHYHFFGKLFEPPVEVGLHELEDLSTSYTQYIQATGGLGGNTEFPEILRSQEILDSLSLIPTSSEFHILGLFAIIEMLITHNPKLEDRGDSITHQMQSKIPLLSKRFVHKSMPEEFFGNVSEKKFGQHYINIEVQ